MLDVQLFLLVVTDLNGHTTHTLTVRLTWQIVTQTHTHT